MLSNKLKISLSLIILIGIFFLAKNGEVISFFDDGKKDDLVNYLRTSNSIVLTSIFFMFLQTVIANLKASNIIFAINEIYGYLAGTLVAWVGAVIGISVVFFLVRSLLHPMIYGFVNKSYFTAINSIINKYGHLMILVLNLSNFFYFDIIIYLAALSTMKFIKFLKAVLVGQFFSLFYMMYVYDKSIKIINVEYVSYGVQYVMPCIVIVFIVTRIIKDRKVRR